MKYLSSLVIILAISLPLPLKGTEDDLRFEEGAGLVFKYIVQDLASDAAFSISRKCSIEHQEYVHTADFLFDKLKLDVVNTTVDSEDYKNCEGVEIESVALTKEKALCYNKEEPSIINVGYIAFMNKSCEPDVQKYYKRFMGKAEKSIPFDTKVIEGRCKGMSVKMRSSNPKYYNALLSCEDRVGILFVNKGMLKNFEMTKRLIEEKVEAVENRPKAKDDF